MRINNLCTEGSKIFPLNGFYLEKQTLRCRDLEPSPGVQTKEPVRNLWTRCVLRVSLNVKSVRASI